MLRMCCFILAGRGFLPFRESCVVCKLSVKGQADMFACLWVGLKKCLAHVLATCEKGVDDRPDHTGDGAWQGV